MKKLIALIITLVACATAPVVWFSNRINKEQELEEELRQYRKIQANNDIRELQAQLDRALMDREPCGMYMYQAEMQKQMELLNKMYQRI